MRLNGSVPMLHRRKLLLFISMCLILFSVCVFIVYMNYKSESGSVSADSGDPMENNEANSELAEGKADENELFPEPMEPMDEEPGEIDYDSIPGLTKCKPFGRRLVEEDSTNILFLGEDKEAKLFDTIGIASVSPKEKKVKIIMIPRDTYIEYNEKVLHYMEKAGKLKEKGVFKINFAYNIGPMMKYEGRFKPYTSMSFLADVIKEKFGVTIHDYIKINVDTFVDIVDLFGGVEINVPYAMNYDDPYQDLHIHLEKGPKKLDGKQAEGFVRFRQGVDGEGKPVEIGDEGRKDNQIKFIKAFISQHGSISNIDKIPKLLKTLGKNVQHSMGLGDVLFKYMGMAKDIIGKKYEIESEILHGEIKWIDGVQYLIVDK